MVLHVEAVKYCGSARGGSQAQIVEASDKNYYVIKAPNNPHGIRTLVNELLGGLILELLEIPTARSAIVQVYPWLVSNNEEMKVTDLYAVQPWQAGPCFGSQINPHGWFPIGLCPFKDELCDHQLQKMVNLEAFVEVLVFDLWAMQSDRRQAVFVRPKGNRGFVATMIDQGLCFGGSQWKLAGNPRHSIFAQPAVYESVFGMDAFDSIIKRMRNRLGPKALRGLAAQIPDEWIDDKDEFSDMLELLNQRLKCLEDLVEGLHDSKFNPFFNWEKTPEHRMHSAFGEGSFEDQGLIPPIHFEQEVAAD